MYDSPQKCLLFKLKSHGTQKEARNKRLLLKRMKSFSIPVKALLFFSLQPTLALMGNIYAPCVLSTLFGLVWFVYLTNSYSWFGQLVYLTNPYSWFGFCLDENRTMNPLPNHFTYPKTHLPHYEVQEPVCVIVSIPPILLFPLSSTTPSYPLLLGGTRAFLTQSSSQPPLWIIHKIPLLHL